MFRWNDVEDQTLFDMTIKMYRDPFVAKDSFISTKKRLELDHYAFDNFQSELYMYRILDTNFDAYIEARGNLDEMGDVSIPTIQDTDRTTY